MNVKRFTLSAIGENNKGIEINSDRAGTDNTVFGIKTGANTYSVNITGKGDVTIEGILTTKTGSSLGGWSTDGNSIYKGGWDADKKTTPTAFMCTGSSTKKPYIIAGHEGTGWVFGAGGEFGVQSNGNVYCNEIHFHGKVAPNAPGESLAGAQEICFTREGVLRKFTDASTETEVWKICYWSDFVLALKSWHDYKAE